MKKLKDNKKDKFEEYEEALYNMGFSCVCGADEVGRGPWAGPITAAAVIVKSDPSGTLGTSKLRVKNLGIDDSKKLTEKKRQEIYSVLTSDSSIIYSVASISAQEIDKIGLGRANHLVLQLAIEGLPNIPDYILVDGFIIKDINMRQERIIKGDSKVLSIAAASIIAKVSRDHYMIELAKEYPQYGFDNHKGYGTKKHIEALKKFGTCPEHRKSFKPISELSSSSS